ncbi:MAG: aspartate-semialdehyde dehydrogenase [Gemmatimonadetes bacterium]|nr:aspartate-semialdehyde dehydrogenase [Gemmatimonadota bacterium]
MSPSPSVDAHTRERIPVALLGATGTVGARLAQRLTDHPWFELVEVAASERSEGSRLGERVAPDAALHPRIAGLTLRSPTADFRSHLILSALPSGAARAVEAELAARGHLVVSNASAYRDDPRVPLIVPEVNADHLALLDTVREAAAGEAVPAPGGGIVTNPNCAVAGLMPAVAPLHRRFGIERLIVTTLQAISGAGRPGPSAIDLVDNVVPYIGGEEDKIAAEPAKILGRVEGDRIVPVPLSISATATRVPVLHGHLESVSVQLSTPASPDEARRAWREFRAPEAVAQLPSSPERVVEIADHPDRPQPRLDRDRGSGMTVTVGRIRPCPVQTLRFLVLSHNLERGAAGAAILNAELAVADGRVRSQL